MLGASRTSGAMENIHSITTGTTPRPNSSAQWLPVAATSESASAASAISQAPPTVTLVKSIRIVRGYRIGAERGVRNCTAATPWTGVRSLVQDDAEQGAVDLEAGSVVVDEAELAELVHEEVDARARRADHLGEQLL